MSAEQARGAGRRIVPILLVALATLIAVAALSEGVARLLFRQSTTTTLKCLIVNDSTTGVRGVPNSFCQQKGYETPLIDYRFNDCGFRTPQPCRAAPADTYRIVLLGSSVTFGMHVQQPESLAGVVGPMISSRLGRPVDVFNEGMQWGLPAGIARRGDRLLAPHPDMILWVVNPFDITNAGLVLPFIGGVQEELSVDAVATSRPSLPAAAPPKGVMDRPAHLWRRVIDILTGSRTVLMLQHYLFQSQSQYISHLEAQGVDADYLRTPPPASFKANLAIFAEALATLAKQAQAAHVPLVITLQPSRAQAILITNKKQDPGFDPRQLDRLLHPIVEAAGATYLDMTPGLERYPDAGQRYFKVDEHLPPEGNAMLADLLADAVVRSHLIPAKGAKP